MQVIFAGVSIQKKTVRNYVYGKADVPADFPLPPGEGLGEGVFKA